MITTPQGFDLQGQEPLELKTKRDDLTGRNAITLATRYEGLTVYVVAERKNYQLKDGITNLDWSEVVDDGFAVSEFISSSSGVADAGKPIVLDATGKIHASMLSASDLSLYYLLDGSRQLTGALNAGTFKLVNIANGTNAQDAVAFNQLSGYLPINGKADDSELLDGLDSSYFLNASNLNSGTIPDARFPINIPGNITGSSATTDEWTTARTLTLNGAVAGSVSIKGNANMSMFTVVLASNVSSGNSAFNKNFGTTSGTVARGDHTHGGTVKDAIEINAWDMNSTASFTINNAFTGYAADAIRSINVVIIGDDDLTTYPLEYYDITSDITAGSCYINQNNVHLERTTGGIFDDSLFSSSPGTRGWVIIEHV